MASPNTSEIVTSTLRNRSKKIGDNVSKSTAILFRLSEKGRIQTVDGGSTIGQPLEYAENGTAMWYSGFEQLNVQASDVISMAEFPFKQAAATVSISGLDELMNSGDSQFFDLLKARIRNAERTMTNLIAQGMYADGTGNGGKEIGGLQRLVADTPTTGIIGGIDRATFSFWRNLSYDATTDGTQAATAANIQKYMNTVYLQLVRGAEAPDLILADNNYYNLYLQSLQSIQRITTDKMAQAGFTSLKYMNADVVLDGGKGGFCPANHMYFLNTDYIFYRPHKKRNMVPIGGDRFSTNQDATTRILGWAGNMTASNLSLQGILKD